MKTHVRQEINVKESIHVGDIFMREGGYECTEQAFYQVSKVLNKTIKLQPVTVKGKREFEGETHGTVVYDFSEVSKNVAPGKKEITKTPYKFEGSDDIHVDMGALYITTMIKPGTTTLERWFNRFNN